MTPSRPLHDTEVISDIHHSGEPSVDINHDELRMITIEEYASAAITLARQACRNINIFTQDMDACIYDNTDFTKALSQMVVDNPRSVIRILVHDSMRAMKTEHRILRLARSMPGSIFIRNPSRLYQHIRSSYMTVDRSGFMYRDKPHRHDQHATLSYMPHSQASALDDSFMAIWEQSTVDRNVRRLYL